MVRVKGEAGGDGSPDDPAPTAAGQGGQSKEPTPPASDEEQCAAPFPAQAWQPGRQRAMGDLVFPSVPDPQEFRVVR